MKLNVSDISSILTDFINIQVVPLGTGIQKFGAYAFNYILINRLPNIIENNKNLLISSGIMNTEGIVDGDFLYNVAKDAISKSGKVNILGYLVDSNDIDKLYEIGNKYAR